MFVDTNPKRDRIAVLKDNKALKDLDDDNTDVFQRSLIDRYEHRPVQLQFMCLAEFAATLLPNTSTRVQTLTLVMMCSLLLNLIAHHHKSP